MKYKSIIFYLSTLLLFSCSEIKKKESSIVFNYELNNKIRNIKYEKLTKHYDKNIFAENLSEIRICFNSLYEILQLTGNFEKLSQQLEILKDIIEVNKYLFNTDERTQLTQKIESIKLIYKNPKIDKNNYKLNITNILETIEDKFLYAYMTRVANNLFDFDSFALDISPEKFILKQGEKQYYNINFHAFRNGKPPKVYISNSIDELTNKPEGIVDELEYKNGIPIFYYSSEKPLIDTLYVTYEINNLAYDTFIWSKEIIFNIK